MTDEPTLGEALRRLDATREDMREGFAQINARLDRLVTNDAFQAEQRRVDDKFRDFTKALDDERTARVRAIAEEKLQRVDDIASAEKAREDGDKRQQIQLDKLTGNLRWLAASIAVPIALFIANIVAAGGKP